MRRDVFGKLQRLPINYFDKRASGDLMTRVVEDINNVERVLIDGTEQGTQLALELTEGSASSAINDLIVIGNVLYLKMSPTGSNIGGTFSHELWWVDLNQY